MGDYTRLDFNQAQNILALYRDEKLKSLSPLSLGISNSNYRIELEDGSQLLLKVSNDKDRDQLAAEQVILATLAELKYPYSLRAYATKDGEAVYNYENYFGVLYPFIAGIPPGPSDMTCAEIGRALAHLHSLKFELEKYPIRSHEEVGYGPHRIKTYITSEKAQKYFVESFERVFP